MKTSKCVGKDLQISTKHSVEICNFIRGKKLDKAKYMLTGVLDRKAAVPFKRYNDNMGHKKGKIASGRYPLKACKEILKLLNSVEANAKNLNLSVNDLYIKGIIANKAARPWHYGRQRRRKMKRTHIELIVEEVVKEKTVKK